MRSLGGGTAGTGNPAGPWRRQRGTDTSPAGQMPNIPWAAAGAHNVHRIGPREYEATVVAARAAAAAPRAARATVRVFLTETLGAPRGLGQFTLDRHGRLVGVRLLDPTLFAGHTLVYEYRYSRLGESVHVTRPG